MQTNVPRTIKRCPTDGINTVVHESSQVHRSCKVVPRSAKEAFAIRDGACIGVWRLPEEALGVALDDKKQKNVRE